MTIRIFVCLAATYVLQACGSPSEAPPEEAVVAPVQAPAPVQAEPEAEPTPDTWRHAVSRAQTSAEMTTGCLDWAVEADLPEDATQRAAEVAELTRPFIEEAPALGPDEFALPTNKSCEEMFADRTVFASCRSSAVNEEARTTMTFATFSYDVAEVYESDGQMRACIEREREWQALPRNSDAVDIALRELQIRRLQDRR